MNKDQYQFEAKSIDAFLDQSIRYVRKGKCFYYKRFVVPDHKDPRSICERLIRRYDIGKKRWERKSRHLGETARIHLLLYGRTFVIMLSHGKHQRFYEDHGYGFVANRNGKLRRVPKPLEDIRRNALKVFGYSIRFNIDRREPKLMIRLEPETRRKVKVHLTTVAVWESFRDKQRMEREFRSLPYQMFEPVYDELCGIARAVNKVRRKAGFEQIDLGCIPQMRRIGTVFVGGRCAASAIHEYSDVAESFRQFPATLL